MNDAPTPGSTPPVTSELDQAPSPSPPNSPSASEPSAAEPSAAEQASAAGDAAATSSGGSAGQGGPDIGAARASQPPARDPRPSFVFFGVLSAASLVADIGSKVWAEIALAHRPSHPIVLIEDHLNLTLAYNPGGAWGLLQDASEQLRKPFFVLVSMAAILFIVSLYSRLLPGQRALKWGLPLVLGGALGNLADRITRSKVIDFIDYRADWIQAMNQQVASVVDGWSVTDHWPTFNVADIAICVGVGLMAIDMFMSRRGESEAYESAPLTQKSPDVTASHDGVALGDEAALEPRAGGAVLGAGSLAQAPSTSLGDNSER